MTGTTLREQLPNGSARNKIEFLADQIEGMKGVKIPLVEQLPPATDENVGTLVGLIERSQVNTGFGVEYLLQSDNIVVASSVYSDEIAVSQNNGKSFTYKTLPTPHVAPINNTTLGKMIRMGVHPSSSGFPLLVYGTKSTNNAIFLSKDLGDTWENLTEKLTSVPAIKPAGATFNALSYNNNTAYQFSVSVDGDLVAVTSRGLFGHGGIAYSMDSGATFKGHRGSNPDNSEDSSVLTWKLSIYDVYDLCVCDDGTEKFGILNAPHLYKMKFGSDLLFEGCGFDAGTHGYSGMGVDPVRNEIYLVDRISPKTYLRYSYADNTFKVNTFPTETYPNGYSSQWDFGHAAKDGGGQISIYDGKMVIGRKISYSEIGVYLFDTTTQTALHLHNVELKYPNRNLLEYTGQATISGDHLLFFQNSQLFKSTDSGNTLNGPNPKSVSLMVSFDGQWSAL